MSVTMDFCAFSMEDGSKSEEVAKIIKWLDKKGYAYKLGAMSMKDALKVLEKANKLIDKKRVYIVAKFDIYKGRTDALKHKVKSVKEKLDK